MKLLLLSLALVLTCGLAFVPSQPSKILQTTNVDMMSRDTDDRVNNRRDFLRTGSFVVASIFGLDRVKPAQAIPEQKVYSSNAKNMMRLGEGDSSGGSGESHEYFR